MKKNNLFVILLIMFFGILVGCSKGYNVSDAIGSDSFAIDKIVFEKNRGDCDEIMAVYFKGDSITKVETRETYSDKDNLSKAYKSYSESSDYVNLRTSGLDIGYEYSSAHIYNFFDGIRGKSNITNVLQNDRGYVVK